MPLLFEHPGIKRALDDTGLSAAEAEVLAPLVLAWSPRELLLCRPEFAVLSLPETQFLRLPVSLVELRSALAKVRVSVPASNEAPILTTPLGQWRWAVERIGGHPPSLERQLRLSELRRFAAERWPGCLEATLSQLEDAWAARVSAEPVLELLRQRGEQAALQWACRPVILWERVVSRRERLIPLENALEYAIGAGGGAFPPERVADRARRDLWWRELADDLGAVEAALDEVKLGGGHPPRPPLYALSALRQSLQLLQVLETTEAPCLELLVSLRAAVQVVVNGLRELAAWEERHRG